MIVDSLGYFGSWPYWKVPIEDASGLLALMDESHIDQLFACSTRGLFESWERGNAEAIGLAAKHPQRIRAAVTFGAESRTETVPTDRVCRLLEDYNKEGVRALRLFPQHQGYSLDSAYVDPVLAQAIRLGFVLMIHVRSIMNWGMPVLPVSHIVSLAARLSGATILVCGANGEWPEVASAMKRLPNLIIETSCLQYLERVAFFTREFSSQRVIYGSGIALQYPLCGLAKVMKAKITPSERENILAGNAQRLLFGS